MKVYLDDNRETPEGWVRAFWPEEVIRLLETEQVEVVSLDHDLGSEDPNRTGYMVVRWIEDQMAADFTYMPPEIRVHSANSVGGDRMRAGIESIKRMLGRRS